jgi:transcription elongation factor GreB
MYSELIKAYTTMSKAFTKESESEDDDLVLPPLPAGGKNYITPAGYARMRDELLNLMDAERLRSLVG